MGERCVRIAEVEGSNPLLSTKRETNVKTRLSPFVHAIPLRHESPSGIWGCTGFDGDVEAG